MFINLKICRYRCPDCNYVFPDEFSFFAKNSHITNRLKDEFVNRVTMDFAPAYARCVRDILPDSLIVIDKFHAVQKVNRCLDRTRIYLQNYYHGECGADTRRFKRAKYLFMTNWEDLSKEGTDRFDPKTAVFICADGSIKSFSDKAKGLYKAPEPSKLESKSIKKGVVSFGMATSYSDFSGIIPKIDSRRITKY